MWALIAPIDPPRRRSSLAFSRLLPEGLSAQLLGNEAIEPSPPPAKASLQTPSNTGRRRIATPRTQPKTTPGHFIHMQRLFQNAKESLRMDMRFAASPVGSIGSRLPTGSKHTDTSCDVVSTDIAVTEPSNKNWRYSTAPGLLAALELDVREPLGDFLPSLPGPMLGLEDVVTMAAKEPLSSGYTSPQQMSPSQCDEHAISKVMFSDEKFMTDEDDIDADKQPIQNADDADKRNLEETMTALRVTSEYDTDEMQIDESPIVAHLERRSRDGGKRKTMQANLPRKGELFLSASARAAAESAKARRGLLYASLSSDSKRKNDVDVVEHTDDICPLSFCPDPSLHECEYITASEPKSGYVNKAPPRSYSHQSTPTPPLVMNTGRHCSIPPRGLLRPPTLPFHRASSTGSPLPIPRGTASPSPNFRAFYHPMQLASSPPTMQSEQAGSYRMLPNGQYPTMYNEHFQPGWYYAQEPVQSSRGHNSALIYSFSTAAAKAIGQSAAPDSRIRDSYRTDTLTPLAKPPCRYRKNGIGAIVNTRSIFESSNESNHNFTSTGYPHSFRGRTSSRFPGDVQFMSSPPKTRHNCGPSERKRRRTRSMLRPVAGIHRDQDGEQVHSEKIPRLANDDEIFEIDEDTRAAVRMSLCGMDALDLAQADQSGLKRLSTNVTPWRKGSKMLRKKRRPSYWDTDLEEVRQSPAGRPAIQEVERTIVNPPVTVEIDDDQDVEICLNEDDLSMEVQQAGDELESRLKEIGVALGDRNNPHVEMAEFESKFGKEFC